MKKFRLDLIREAIKLWLDNPNLSNREVARQLNVTETTIRYWKKQSFWENERQKLIDERAEIMELDKAEKRAEYKENLERQERNLEILMEQIFANTMRAITLSNKVLATASMMDDPLKACSMVAKSGALKHSKAAIEGAKAYVAINENLYQFHILIEYFEGLEEESDR
ncbi:MAG: phage terminase small subunit-related protein [Planktothrix sp.]|uniref:phage terminase small subunit-related protein n=2 Tax=Planktothrix sp. TaxID=3088171 RepID=UPI0038D45AE9